MIQLKNTLLTKSTISYELGSFRFKNVTDSKEVKLFNKLVYNTFHEAIGVDFKSERYRDIIRKSKDLDEKLEDQMWRIIGYNKENRVVGTMAVYTDGQKQLPAEIKGHVDFSNLRERCKIVEVGRMAICKEARFIPLLSFGLNMFILYVCMQTDSDVIIESAFKDKYQMFERIGFKKFKYGKSWDQICDVPKILCYYNFSAYLDAYFNPENVNNEYILSNYTNRIFRYMGEADLLAIYDRLFFRNAVSKSCKKTFYENFDEILLNRNI